MSKNKQTRELSEEQVRLREESRQRKEDENLKKKEEYLKSSERAQENQKKAEALLKANIKKKNSNLSYHIMFALLGAVCLYVIVMMFLNQAPPLHKVPVIEDKKIEEHNNNNVWKQGPNEFFEGSTLAEAKKLMNAGFASHQNLQRCQIDDSVTPPENYFYKEHFPNCIIPTQDMSKSCGASYAFVVAQTLAERSCIASGAEKAVPLSAQELLKCDIMNNGCKNGHLNLSLDHLRTKGLVEESCLTYNPEAEKCEGMCDVPRRTRIDSYCLLVGDDDIKRDIMKNGPVVSTANVFVDFLTYKSGVYTKGEEVARFAGQHAIRIVGWGTETGEENEQNKGNKYWIIQNTWGKTWGEDGFAKISVGQELFFDQYAYSIRVRSMPHITRDATATIVNEPKETKEEQQENFNLDLEEEAPKEEATN